MNHRYSIFSVCFKIQMQKGWVPYRYILMVDFRSCVKRLGTEYLHHTRYGTGTYCTSVSDPDYI
jgi:hypothetical protein